MRKLAVVLMGIAFCGPLVWSQVNTATISGTVRDASGAVLPGANIAVLNQDTGITRTVTSNAAGRYAAPALNLGNYQVTTQLAGFQTSVRSGVVLTVGQEAVIDVTMQVGAVTQTVEVTGEAPLVETSNANLAGLIDDQTIRDMPLNARSWDNLALLQPGIVNPRRGRFRLTRISHHASLRRRRQSTRSGWITGDRRFRGGLLRLPRSQAFAP